MCYTYLWLCLNKNSWNIVQFYLWTRKICILVNVYKSSYPSIIRGDRPRLISLNIFKSKTWLQLQMFYLSTDGAGLGRAKRNWFLHNLVTKTPPRDLSVALKTKHSFVFYYFRRNKCIFYNHMFFLPNESEYTFSSHLFLKFIKQSFWLPSRCVE
jgi:hypothetical protein